MFVATGERGQQEEINTWGKNFFSFSLHNICRIGIFEILAKLRMRTHGSMVKTLDLNPANLDLSSVSDFCVSGTCIGPVGYISFHQILGAPYGLRG